MKILLEEVRAQNNRSNRREYSFGEKLELRFFSPSFSSIFQNFRILLLMRLLFALEHKASSICFYSSKIRVLLEKSGSRLTRPLFEGLRNELVRNVPLRLMEPIFLYFFQPTNMWFTYNDGILGSCEDWHTPARSSSPASWGQQRWCNVCSNRKRCTARHHCTDCQSRRGERRK